MNSRETEDAWSRKGGTLSDKSACKEFGLTQEEIVEAINRGKLQYRVQSMYGNPFLRLIRSEVEALVKKKHGGANLAQKKMQTELAQIEKKLRSLKRQMTLLEKRKAELLASLHEVEGQHRSRGTRLK